MSQVDMIVGTHALIQEKLGIHWAWSSLTRAASLCCGTTPDFTGKGDNLMSPWRLFQNHLLLQHLVIWMCPSLTRCRQDKTNHHPLGQHEALSRHDWRLKELIKGAQVYLFLLWLRIWRWILKLHIALEKNWQPILVNRPKWLCFMARWGEEKGDMQDFKGRSVDIPSFYHSHWGQVSITMLRWWSLWMRTALVSVSFIR